MDTIEFLKAEKEEVKVKIVEDLDNSFKVEKWNEKMRYLDYLISKAEKEDLDKTLEEVRKQQL